MKTSEFDYALPLHLIAQTPTQPRDHSRLMVLSRATGEVRHCHFYEIVDLLQPGDVLVFNDSRVLPARLRGRKRDGGKVELLLLRSLGDGVWETLVRPGRRVREGDEVEIVAAEGQEQGSAWGEVVEKRGEGIRVVRFPDDSVLERLGQTPLPPYIHTPLDDPERYQTTYARVKGSVAAPTAGLHFTPELLDRLRDKGIDFVFLTLHVGLDSFRPVRAEDPCQHPIHREHTTLSEEAALRLTTARREGRRVMSVGTSTLRALEGVASMRGESERGESEPLMPFGGFIDLFILPGYRFRVVDALLTNFHLPRSTLLMLVSAFAGRELIAQAYQEAINLGYRFYSFGDCMFIQ